MNRHIAVIPARAGSVGFPGKNRMFFDNTADFLAGLHWLDRTIVSTDDSVVQEKARARGFAVRERPADLAGSAVSIKAVFEDLIPAMNVRSDDVLWLFYLPVLFKRAADFDSARETIERPEIESLCTFVPAKTHPYTCWRQDEADGKLSQYVPNDVFRRQDMPPAWMQYHYVCCFKASALGSLNPELANARTHPVFLDAATAANLIEVDTPADYERWKKHVAENRRHGAA